MKNRDFNRKIEVAANRNIKERDYWLEKLSGELVKSHFLYDFKQSRTPGNPMESVVFTLPADLFEPLNKLSGGSSHKLHMVLSAVLVLLLQRYTGYGDIIIGAPIYKQDIEGEFVNTVLALRTTIADPVSTTFKDLLLSVRQTIFAAVENQNYPIEALLYQLDLPFDEKDFPLFDAVLLVEGIHDKTYIQHIHPKMIFSFSRIPGSLKGDLEYHKGLYEPSTAARIINHFICLMRQALSDVNTKIAGIDILSAEEKKQLLVDFNDTGAEWPAEKTVHGLFAEQAAKTPGNTALVFEKESLTYLELEEAANRLANYLLLEKNVRPDHRVGLLIDKSIVCIAAILGIQKAGGAYVPIDPSLPPAGIRHIIADAGIEMLVSQKKYIKVLNRLQWECRCLHGFLCMDSSGIHNEKEERNPLMDRKLWEYVGETAVDDITGGGWQSSYTGEPLSREEMEEYGQNVESKLTPLVNKTSRILEIGCATGLTMYRLAPKAGFYYGTDLSPVIIQRNNQRVQKEGHTNIKLESLPAHDIHNIEEKNFDLIILNSVIQHFDGHNYLRQVIKKAIHLLGDQGAVFIGDIMDQDRKGALIKDLKHFKNTHRDKKYRTKTDWSEELFISKFFFRDLAVDFPGIRAVEFSGKIGAIENELTKFRYDALITVDKTVEAKNAGHKFKYQDDLRSLAAHGTKKVSAPVSPHNLLYIIYTSGTMGKPKGAMVEHRNVVRLMKNNKPLFDFNSDDVWTMFHAYNFDFSVWEMYGALLFGGKLVIIPRMTARDTQQYLEILKEQGVTVLNQTPPAFYNLSREEEKLPERELKTRYVIFGGEALDPGKLKPWRDRYPHMKLINMYGITETTVHVTYKELTGKELESGAGNIGKPIPTLVVYIMDRNFCLLPIGAAGELYVGGEGVGRGYLNRPELTDEKFCLRRAGGSFEKPPPAPPQNFCLTYQKLLRGVQGGGFLEMSPPGRRRHVYKTGDLARYLTNGDLEYLGRVDQQVKIRGFRIELGEIESHLRDHDEVKEAVVISRDDGFGDRFLAAYVVVTKGFDISGLKDYLAVRLPGYMIPLYFVPMDRIPLTANGKLNRKALPEPMAPEAGRDYIAPRDDIEKKLAGVWSEVLHIEKEKISMEGNFFELGGHSLKATALIANIHKALDVKVPLAEVFKTPTIGGLARFIKKAAEDKFAPIKAVEEKEYYPLSSAQKRLFVLERLDNTNYNKLSVSVLAGNINLKKLGQAFKKLVARHESLRTSFHLLDNQPVQRVHKAMEFEVKYYDLSTEDIDQNQGAEEENIINDFIRPYNLSEAPLLRVGVVKKGKSRHLLVFNMHHIIYDGVSLEIFEKEFFALYRAEELPVLKGQYKDYAQWQNSAEQREAMKKQEAYWLKVFAGEIPLLNLPTDFSRPEIQSFEGGTEKLWLDEAITGSLNRVTAGKGATLFVTLLAVYNILLHKYTGQEDIIIGTSNANRSHSELQNIIGMFVNMVVMRNFPVENKTFAAFLTEVKKNVLDAFENQDYPYEELLRKLHLHGDSSKDPLNVAVFAVGNFKDVNKTGEGALSGSDDLKTVPYEHKARRNISFDLELFAYEFEDRILLSLNYSTRLFKPSTARKIIEHFVEILTQVLADENLRLKDILISHDLSPAVSEIIHDDQKDFFF